MGLTYRPFGSSYWILLVVLIGWFHDRFMEKIKRGTVRGDGLIFWSLKGKKVDQWVTAERFEVLRIESNAYLREYMKNNRKPDLERARKARYRVRMSAEKKRAEYHNNKSNRLESARKFREANRERLNEKDRMLKVTDPEKWTARLNRRRNSKSYLARLAETSRVRMRQALKGQKRYRSCMYLGCDWPSLARHLEAQFQDGMSWDNHRLDGWHIDHIIPLASAKTLEELIPLLHHSNLQPLWALENLKKGDRIVS